MYVCLCRGITEEKIESMLGQGMSDNDVLKRLGVGSDCGICLIDAVKEIKSKLASKKDNSLKKK